jgi:hypothetical protein
MAQQLDEFGRGGDPLGKDFSSAAQLFTGLRQIFGPAQLRIVF